MPAWFALQGLTLTSLNFVDHAHNLIPAGAGQVTVLVNTFLGLVFEFLQGNRKILDTDFI